MDASKLQLLYLKLLYSGLDEVDGETEEAAYLLRHMKQERLAVERAARLRNLRTVLYSEMKILSRIVSAKELLPYIEAYAASPNFWKYSGRTQVEDFCLYMASRHDVDPIKRIACEIEGVYSGLSSGPGKTSSPWEQHRIEHSAEQTLEHFTVPFSARWTDEKGNDVFNVKDGSRHYRCTVKIVKERVVIDFK